MGLASEQERSAKALGSFSPSQGAEKDLETYGVKIFPCPEEKGNDQVQKACFEARRAYYDYFAAGLPRRTKVYEWNNFSTKVIFFAVLSLVGIGIYFSWKQFFGIMTTPVTGKTSGTSLSSPLVETPVTELELGFKGVRVKSPVLGVILLTLSLAFFYLYLKYVYPVTEHF